MEPARAQSNEATTTLTIESRDLDTDARERTVIDSVPPLDPNRQRAALAEAVERIFPRAKLRSFSNGAATFLDMQHLIVASYAELPRSNGRRATGEVDEQQKPLFAA
jgi:hypothetical protein